MNATMHTRSTPTVEVTDQRVIDTARISLRAAAADGEAGGTFEGYAVLWDIEDSWGTKFAPRCASAGGLDEDLYALLDMHDREKPVGTFTAKEDDRGLLITGTWDDTSAGRDARARALSGSAPGLSIGFQALMIDPDDETRFLQIRLVEVSQITARMQAVPGAGFTGARAAQVQAEQKRAAELGAARARLALTAPVVE